MPDSGFLQEQPKIEMPAVALENTEAAEELSSVEADEHARE